jgi:lipoprotein NlpD
MGRGLWAPACVAAFALLCAACGGPRVAPRAQTAPGPVAARPKPLRDAAYGVGGVEIPSLERTVPVVPMDGLALAPLERAPAEVRPSGAPRLAWPLSGPVTSLYGRRGRRHHDGIDIGAPPGTEVRAAAGGAVVYVGSLRGYGRMIIILHDGGFATVYAHNARQQVRAGARVRRGDLIATVGRTGRTTGPNLHFEVRRNNIAYDPLAMLPAPVDRVARGD